MRLEGARGRGAAGPRRGGRRPAARSSSSAGRPTAAGRATSGPIFVRRDAPPARGRDRAASASTAGRSTPTGRRTTQVPERAAAGPAACAAARRSARAGRSCSKGGSIDVNGRGTLLTTEECLLDPIVQVRNPGFTRADYESVFRAALGRHRTCSGWARGSPATTPTATWTTSAASWDRGRSCSCREKNRGRRELPAPRGEPRAPRRACGSRTARGPRSWPCPCRRRSSSTASACPRATRTSTSPTRRCSCRPSTTRTTAWPSASWRELFPDRPVVGIHAVDLVWGLGTLHCLTQQQPRASGSGA